MIKIQTIISLNCSHYLPSFSRIPVVSRTDSAAFCCCCHKMRFWFNSGGARCQKQNIRFVYVRRHARYKYCFKQFSSCLTGKTHKVTQTGNFNMYSGGTYLRVSQLLNLGEQPSPSDDSTETFACCRREASHRVPEEHRERLRCADGLL